MNDTNEAKYFNDQGKILCQECNAAYQVIGATHLKKHGLTMTQYKEKYPDAPVSSKAFKAKSQLKHLNLEGFGTANKTDDFKKEPDPIPDHKEILKKAAQKEKAKEKVIEEKPPMFPSKAEIITFLKTMYSSIVENYFIEKTNLSGLLEYRYVTDIIDRSSKTDFEFRGAPWHNKYPRQDRHRDQKLKQDGWTIIRIDSPNPTVKMIKDHMDIVY